MKLRSYVVVLSMVCISCLTMQKRPEVDTNYQEPHRLQIHFSPKEKWMNDPNGLLFYNNQYHLFYQYFPDSTVWGPMHWGHATSADMIHWEHQPIALYPDTLGYIFSGSAVADVNNTSGLGKNGQVPLVAIFTHHDPAGEKQGKVDYQNQSLAYSLDAGKTWTKYAGNPVLRNPGVKDFRDPKVSWYEPEKKWVMTLATQDRISFYSSKNLIEWKKESEFGSTVGAHGGVWECPDLFPLDYNGEKVWVLLVSINPGGPNGGSATQYFTGNFDGREFRPFQTDIRWLDAGPDDYAGVTWSNTGERKIFLGWMSNWQYGTMVPTQKWRSAMTVPRDLSLEKISDKYFVRSMPVPELNRLNGDSISLQDIAATNYDLTAKAGKLDGPVRLNFSADTLKKFAITLSNADGEKSVIGYDGRGKYYFDRRASGETTFEKGFAAVLTAPRVATTVSTNMTLVIDNASVEMFADNGLTVMSGIFFPKKNYDTITITSEEGFTIAELRLTKLHSIWR